MRYILNVMINLITKLFSPKSYIGDLGLCFFLALLFYITGFLFFFRRWQNSALVIISGTINLQKKRKLYAIKKHDAYEAWFKDDRK